HNAYTKEYPGVNILQVISINNAFGRLWPANAPNGLSGLGTSSILDPQGWGLAGAPNALIGGEYTGTLTNRSVVTALPQVTPGALNTAAVGTALFGKSPDGATPVRAVFVVVGADGTLVQEHTAKGLDGLDAPAGSIDSIVGRPDEFNGDDKV